MRELICIGLPGLTHNYGGLSADNVASNLNQGSISRPREAALQVIALMRLLKSLGQDVAILPPQLRPYLPMLREKYKGSDEEIIRITAEKNPALLEKACSASAMWTANAATVTPSIDAEDKKLHLTVANLHTHTHRRIEAKATYNVLKQIFGNAVLPPLSAARGYLDEGAANHMRLSNTHADKGLHVFVYGKEKPRDAGRQSLSACKRIAKTHAIPLEQVLYLRQNPAVIKDGVFHNDVIAVSHENVLLVHEAAYLDKHAFDKIGAAYSALNPEKALIIVQVSDAVLTVKEAVETYFFNSQIVSTPQGMMLIAPEEVKGHPRARALVQRIIGCGLTPVKDAYYIDLRQSMRNGGGPACLRLRVLLTEKEFARIRARVIVDETLLSEIEDWVRHYYPSSLSSSELADIALYRRSKESLEALGMILRLSLL